MIENKIAVLIAHQGFQRQAALRCTNLLFPPITRTTLEAAEQLEDLTDWKKVKSLSDSEIEANALSDPDSLPLSPDTMKHLKRVPRDCKGQ